MYIIYHHPCKQWNEWLSDMKTIVWTHKDKHKILPTHGILSIPHKIVMNMNNVMKKPRVKTIEWWVASLRYDTCKSKNWIHPIWTMTYRNILDICLGLKIPPITSISWFILFTSYLTILQVPTKKEFVLKISTSVLWVVTKAKKQFLLRCHLPTFIIVMFIREVANPIC